MNAPTPEDEQARLEELASYGILDTPPEAEFDDLVSLAAQLCGAPIAMINFVDRNRVWAKANIGFPETEIGRKISFCGHVVAARDLVHVEDTFTDKRFSLSPLVIQSPKARSYVGVPLLTPSGRAVGTLCVMDYEPRALAPEGADALRTIARQVVAQLQLRRTSPGAPVAAAFGQGRTGAEAPDSVDGDQLSVIAEQMPAAVWTVDAQLRFKATIGADAGALHLAAGDVIGRTLFDYFGTDDPEFAPIAAHLRAIRGESPSPMRWTGWGRTLEVHIEPLRDTGGEIVGALGMATDVSEQAQLEQALAQAQVRVRELATASSRAINVDERGPATAAALGLQVEEALAGIDERSEGGGGEARGSVVQLSDKAARQRPA